RQRRRTGRPSMLSRADALRQVMRFAHYPRQAAQSENAPAATDALIRAFLEVCDTDAMAVAVANEVERAVEGFPVPAHVHAAAQRVIEQIAGEVRYSEKTPTPYDSPGSFDPETWRLF